jgi:hypothetical protein
VSKPGDDH